MITLIHGGQTGVDRGAHEGALDVGWGIAGYMPRDRRDERGTIPESVARYRIPHVKTYYTARTEANVQLCDAVLLVVRLASTPRATPGTAQTLDLAAGLRRPRIVTDPTMPAAPIARWIWDVLIRLRTLPLPIDSASLPPVTTPRLMIAGPRESKWAGARTETAGLLRRIARSLAEISRDATIHTLTPNAS